MKILRLYPSDQDIGIQLMKQVSEAVPKSSGASEVNVTTVITRPLWESWCRFVGIPEDSRPTEWVGLKDTIRVYGSKTIVVESEFLAAASFPSLGITDSWNL